MLLFLGVNLDDCKVATTLTDEWKEKLQKRISTEVRTDTVKNWLESPRWLRGEINHLAIGPLKERFNGKSHYDTDLYIGVVKGATFLIDIAAQEDLEDESIIVRAYLDKDQEK